MNKYDIVARAITVSIVLIITILSGVIGTTSTYGYVAFLNVEAASAIFYGVLTGIISFALILKASIMSIDVVDE